MPKGAIDNEYDHREHAGNAGDEQEDAEGEDPSDEIEQAPGGENALQVQWRIEAHGADKISNGNNIRVNFVSAPPATLNY